MRKLSLVFLSLCVVGYMAWMGAVIMLAPLMMYKPVSEPFVHSGNVSDVDGIPVVVVPGTSDKVVLYLQGTTGKRSGLIAPMESYNEKGFHVVSFAYPGAEGRPGKMSEEQLVTDALSVFDALSDVTGVENPKVVVHGYSLGGGLALRLGLVRDFEALVFQSGVFSMCEIVGQHAFVPACIMNLDQWDMRGHMTYMNEPTLIVHGALDEAVPLEQAEWLEGELKGAGVDVERVVYPETGHTGFQHTSYLEEIDAFLSKRF